MKDIAQAMSIGFAIIGQIGLGCWLGYLLDSRFQSKPIWMIVGILVGTISAFLSLYRMTVKK